MIIGDAPPAICEKTRTILRSSDIVVIPVSPSHLDLWSCKDTLKTVEEIQRQHPDLEVRFLINRKIPGTRIGREVRDTLLEFAPATLNTELGQRVAYIDAMKYGVSVMQFAPGSKAAEEIEQLCDELISAKHKSENDGDGQSNPMAELYREATENILFRSFQGLL